MALFQYPARFCDETPFLFRRIAWDEDSGRYLWRFTEGRLQVRPGKMHANLTTPAGVPILWSHNRWTQAVGRVLEMKFKGGELTGRYVVSDEDLRQFVAGGTTAIDEKINAGLSVGLQFLEEPPVVLKLRKGTAEKPDIMTYGRVSIVEVSLTPTPRIATAGTLAAGERMGGKPKDNEEPSNEAQ